MLTPFGATTDATQGSRTSARVPVETAVRTSMPGPAARLRVIVWLAALGAGVALLHRLGAGILEAPPHSPGDWSSWWSASDPIVATMALLRLVVLALGWYLLVATLLGLFAHACRSVTLWRVAELVTARSMREMVAGLVGVALVSATSAPASAAPTLRSDEGATPIPIQLVLEDGDDPDVDDQDGVVSLDPGIADPSDASDDLRRFRRRGGPLGGSEAADRDVGEGFATESPTDRGSDRGASGSGGGPEQSESDPAGTEQSDPAGTEQSDPSGARDAPEPAAPAPRGDAPPGPAPDDAASPTTGSASDEHVVEAGESFWAIASDVLAQAGEPTDDRTVERYWRVLMEANHDRLVVEGNPDLILPGQRLRVPPPASLTGPGVAP